MSLLTRLTDQQLRDIGVKSLGHRIRIMDTAAEWKPSDDDNHNLSGEQAETQTATKVIF